MARARVTPHKRFAVWLKSQESQRKAAAMLGISQSYANKIANGHKTPEGMPILRAIERATKGIPGGAIRPGDWEVAPRAPKPEAGDANAGAA